MGELLTALLRLAERRAEQHASGWLNTFGLMIAAGVAGIFALALLSAALVVALAKPIGLLAALLWTAAIWVGSAIALIVVQNARRREAERRAARDRERQKALLQAILRSAKSSTGTLSLVAVLAGLAFGFAQRDDDG